MIGINESPGTSSKFPGLSSASPKRVTLRVHDHFSLRSNTWLERVSPPIIEGIFKHYPYEFSRMFMLPHSPTSRVKRATTVPLYNGFLSQPVVGCYHRYRPYSLSRHCLFIRFSARSYIMYIDDKSGASLVDAIRYQPHQVSQGSANGHSGCL